MKILIIGHGQHGKDTFAEMLGVKFKSSSMAALEIFLFDRLNSAMVDMGMRKYETIEEAFSDRSNFRTLWYNEIREYNREDPCKLAKGILEYNDCYVGMRSKTEYDACMEQGLFDVVFWVDASDRVSQEDISSMQIEKGRNMIVIDNNKTHEYLTMQSMAAKMTLDHMAGEKK